MIDEQVQPAPERAKILVVDDDLGILKSTGKTLNDAGYTVLSTTKGEECLDICRRRRPRLVLLSVALPEAGGYDVCRAIKSDPALTDVFVALVYGDRTSFENRNTEFDALAEDSLPRPASPQQLLAKVKTLLRHQSTLSALRESERIQRLFIDHAPTAMAMFDREMRYLAASRRWITDYNLGGRSVIGRCHYDLFPDLPNRWVEAHRRGMAGEVVTRDEDIYEHPDGTVLWLKWEQHPWYTADGQVGGIVIVIEDITERKLAEESLRESEERLELALAGTELGLWDWEIQTNRVTFNERWAEMLGYRLDEIQPEVDSWEKLVHPDDIPKAREVIEAHLTGGAGYMESEHRLRHKSGDWIWVFSKGRVTERNTDGQPTRACGTHLDITERKLAEQALRQSEARLQASMESLQAIADNTPALVYVFDRDARLLLANQSLQDMLERPASALTGKRRHEFLPPEMAERHDANDRLVIERGTPQQFEETGISDGRTVTYLTVKFPLRDADGKIWGVGGISTDISVRKQTEEKLRQSEERFASIFHTSPAAMTVTRMSDGMIIDANDTFLRLFEYDRAEAIGHTSISLGMLGPEDRQALISDQPESGGLRNAELRARSKSGSPLDLLFSSKPIELAGEACHITTMIDITEHKRAEEALRASESRFRSALDNMLEGCQIVAHDWRYLYINPAAERQNRRPAESFLGRTVQEMWPGIEGHVVYGAFKKCMEQRTSEQIDIEFVFPCGETGWFDVHLHPVPEGMFIRTIETTARTQAEQALRESEERLRLSTELANVAVWEHDFRTNQTARSANHDRLYGLEKQAPWEFETFLHTIHPDDRRRSNDRIQASIQPGGPDDYSFDFRVIHPDKSVHWLNVVGQVVKRDSSGNGVLVRGCLSDITERIASEAALRESEECFSTTFQMNPIAASLLRISDWKLTAVNDAWCDLMGISAEEAIGRTTQELGIVENQVRQSAREQYLREKSLQNVEVAIDTRRNGKRNVYISVAPLRLSGEDFAIAMIVDVTDRKEAEKKLRVSEERFRCALENIPDVIVIYDRELRIQYINAATTRITGQPATYFIGRRDEELWPPEVYQAYLPLLQGAVTAKRAHSEEIDIDLPQTGPHAFEITCVPLFDDAGEVHEVMGVTHDMTERKQAEKELAQYREHLENLVTERTAQLEQAHEQLVRQERLATLGQLTATVSHELRNPLGTIRTSLFTIGDRLRGKDTHVDAEIDRAERSIVRCDRIIEELLDYVRGKQLRQETTVIDAWLDGVLDDQAFPDEIRLVRQLSSDVTASIDPERLRRCVINLCTNAFQAIQENEPPGGTLLVETRVAGKRLELRVVDTGPGIPPEDLEHIMEPLYSTKGFGVGLGLPIVQQIIELHGGGIEINSVVGQGTTVTLWLPYSN